MKAELVGDAHAADWQDYLLRADGATFYHQYRWKTALEQAYGLKTCYLAAKDGADVHGILPLAEISGFSGSRSLVSTPFANYGGVVADSASARDCLIDEAGRLLKDGGMSLLELKQDTRCDHHLLVDKLDYHALSLSLSADPEDVWKTKLNTKVRNQTRKAMKSEMKTAIGPELLPEFLPVYRRNLRDLGTPTHSMRWFRVLVELFPKQMTTVVVRLGGKPVAGAWILLFKDTAILHAAASLKEYRRLCPNNLVYWTAIEFLCRKGYRVLDFARSRVGAGTYHFKQQWGAVPRQLHYQYLLNTAKNIPDMDPHNPKYRLAIALWRHLPLSIANAAGPWLRRRIST